MPEKKKKRDNIGGSGGSALGLALAGGIGGGVGGGLGGLPFTYWGQRAKDPKMPPRQAFKLSVLRNMERISGGTMGGLAAAVLLDKLSSLREGFAKGLEEGDSATTTYAPLQEILKKAQNTYEGQYNDEYQAFSPEIMNAMQQEQRPSLAAELTLPALIAGGVVAGGVGYPFAKKHVHAGWAKLKPKLPKFMGLK